MKTMSPCRESFGEEWVETDDDEENIKEMEASSFEAKGDKSVVFECKKKINEMEEGEDMIHKEASVESSLVCMRRGFKSEGGLLLVEEKLEICELIEGKDNKEEEDGLEMKGEYHLQTKDEHLLEMKCSMHDTRIGGDMIAFNENLEHCPRRRCLASGGVERVPMLKRVMSEARFMRGQVMVSKSESIQVVMSKRESSKAEEGTLNLDGSNEETRANEKKVEGEDVVAHEEALRAKEKKVEGEDVVVHQLASMPPDKVPWALEEVDMHPKASEAVVSKPIKALEEAYMPPKSPKSKALKDVHMQMHSKVSSKALEEVH
eukprot:c18501_g1_i2 orf=1-951(-)